MCKEVAVTYLKLISRNLIGKPERNKPYVTIKCSPPDCEPRAFRTQAGEVTGLKFVIKSVLLDKIKSSTSVLGGVIGKR
jgi:hypothetical protein